MKAVIANKEQELKQLLKEFSGNPLAREKYLSRILSLVDGMLRSEKGIQFLYDHIEQISKAGLFDGTSWEHPARLVPSLVEGTLASGFPNVIYESLSELRMLRISAGKWKHPDLSDEQARKFLQDAVISSFALAFGDSSEESRHSLSKNSRSRIALLFSFILERMPLATFIDKLAREVKEYADQRPIMTGRLEEILELVKTKIDLNGHSESEDVLQYHMDALFHPSETSRAYNDPEDYRELLQGLDRSHLIREAEVMAKSMHATGLVSVYHALLLREVARNHRDLIPLVLGLNSHGRAESERHTDFVVRLIQDYVSPDTRSVVYGLARLLNRTLLSRKAVLNALTKLLMTRPHPEVRRRLTKAVARPAGVEFMKWLGGGIINLLGSPLGVGQGLNPTCQSARGLSMWSRHSPGKLINMLASVVASNELSFRFEGELIKSDGLIDEKSFDYNLDPVSVILVPHLDRIYQQMMQKAQLKYPGKDAHVTVNPAFYGLWIQTGFISCYNPLLNMIQQYRKFVKLFYAAFHPQYNGGFRLAYPVPLGIFITTSQAEFLGFHAISLLRVEQDDQDIWRAYFFNPNNEGRQNWGQGIKPAVSGNGENHGESSLPFQEFVSRVYAFHFNSFDAESNLKKVPEELAENVEKLARESWGRNYYWD